MDNHQPINTNSNSSSNNPRRRSVLNTNNNATTSPHPASRPGLRSSASSRQLSTRPANSKITKSQSTAAARASSRAPLRHKDENVYVRTVLLKPGTAAAANMPRDRSPHSNGNRPQMPSLSAAAARAVNRSPMMPKLASSKGPQTPTARPLAVTTPSSTRNQQRPKSSAADDGTNPFLASNHTRHNITPRSGSRQSRVDSANNTPNGTPNPDRQEAWESSPYSGGDGINAPPPLGTDPGRKPAVSFSTSTNESKFFHASDAKSTRPPSASAAKITQQQKTQNFFHANGNPVEAKPVQPVPQALPANQSHDNLSSKFMYANGTPDIDPIPAVANSRSSGSIGSNDSKQHSNRPNTSQPNSYFGSRPISPTKPATQSQGQAKANNLPPISTGRAQATSQPQLGPAPNLPRRSSSGLSRPGHSRSGSLMKNEHVVKFASPSAQSEIPSPTGPGSPVGLGLGSPSQPLTLASIIQAAEDFAEKDEEKDETESPDESRSEVQSPAAKSNHSADPLSELVANARRERKVQDLQITNASLEAINRTLERQMKKQTAELRRYKRLSRSGRLSTMSAAISGDPASEDPTEEGMMANLSDLDEENSSLEDELDEESLSEIDSADEPMSPGLTAERDLKHQARDEKRLELDLSKHQQLLVGSQKINQSIKRCLDWTEELIKDGRKALEYSVRVSDVEIGGRVLDRLDEEDEIPTTQFNNDDTLASMDKLLESVDEIIEEPAQATEKAPVPQDRDSGVELPVDS